MAAPSVHCHSTAGCEQWRFLLLVALTLRVAVHVYPASLLWAVGDGGSCWLLPHCHGQWAVVAPARHCHSTVGSGWWCRLRVTTTLLRTVGNCGSFCCAVVRCGVAWHGVVWCGVMSCGVRVGGVA